MPIAVVKVVGDPGLGNPPPEPLGEFECESHAWDKLEELIGRRAMVGTSKRWSLNTTGERVIPSDMLRAGDPVYEHCRSMVPSFSFDRVQHTMGPLDRDPQRHQQRVRLALRKVRVARRGRAPT